MKWQDGSMSGKGRFGGMKNQRANDFLRKINLIDHLTTNLKMTKKDFAEKLSQIIDVGSTGIFANPFEAFSASKNEFKGQVAHDGFEIKRRTKFFDNYTMAVAKGTFTESNGQLIIETEIKGWYRFILLFYAILLLFYVPFLTGLFFTHDKMVFLIIPFLILHAAGMFSIPYFMTRRSVRKFKYELEREFFYLTKN
jgi:hypothetical protein